MCRQRSLFAKANFSRERDNKNIYLLRIAKNVLHIHEFQICRQIIGKQTEV